MVDQQSHYKKVKKVLWWVLALNWGVAAAKIIYGLITHASSMTADGFHSLADGTSNIIALIGIGIASHPRDEDHPYGHKKYETLFALGIAAMLIMVALTLAKKGISGIIHPVIPTVDALSFVVMLITLAVNITVMRYEFGQGKLLLSDLLVVDSMHTRADIFTSFSVIVALIGAKLGFPIIDPVITLFISGFIAYSALEIIREESGILCDAVAIDDVRKIEEVVLKIKGVKSCHKIRSRGRLDDVHVDLHVQVAGSMSIHDSHEISHKVQAQIIKELPQVVDVMVHMEPSGEAN
jgi:cation diffusion facilitator family transporter